jgi:hypothetical protein
MLVIRLNASIRLGRRIFIRPPLLQSHDFRRPSDKHHSSKGSLRGEVLCSRLGGRRALSANTSSSSHLRESPLQSNLSAIWSVERTRRSFCLPDFPEVSSVGTPSGPDRGERPTDRVRRVAIEGGLAAFRESPWPVVSDRLVVILHDSRITTNTSLNIREIGGPIMTPSYDSTFFGMFTRHK